MLQDILFLIIVLATNIIQAITGFAGTLLAMPASIMLVGADNAKVMLNMVTMATCIILAVRNRKYIQWKILLRILVFMAVGMIAGVLLFDLIELDLLLNLYGAMILVIAIMNLVGKQIKKITLWAGVIVLLVSGIIHGMFLSGGGLLVVYATIVLKDKNEFRATISSVWVVLNTVLLIQQFASGQVTRQNGLFALAACIPALAGVFIGNKLHNKMSGTAFMRLTYILLIVSGVLCFF